MVSPAQPGAGEDWLLRRGVGAPTTLYSHGFGGGIPDTRPFAAGVEGGGAFVHLRGHGGRPSPGPGWTYAGLAEELGDAIAASGATRALGVSMSAGALVRYAAEHPGRLERLVLVLPAALDGSPTEALVAQRDAARRLRSAVEAGNAQAVAEALSAREPAAVRAIPAARAWFAERARTLIASDQKDGLDLPWEAAVPDAARLAAIDVPVLILTHEDDVAHPVSVARAYAELLPRATLTVLPAGSILWLGRAQVRDAVSGFLND